MGKFIIVAIVVIVLAIFTCCGITGVLFLVGTLTTSDQNSNQNNVIDNRNVTDDFYDDTNTNQNLFTEPTTQPLPNRTSEECLILSQTELPANWPDDFPVYAGARITAVRCDSSGTDLFEVRMQVAGSVSEVDAYYDDELTNLNWTVTENMNNDTYNTYSEYMLLNAEKNHPNLTRQIILDIRKRLDNEQNGEVEIIYRERAW